MTVIELLAASGLAALLLAAVSGVLGTLSRHQRALVEKQTPPRWQRQFVEQLQWDLSNARRYEAAPKELRLAGFGGRDFSTGEVTFCRAEVRYEIVEIAEDSWLVRQEIHPDDHALDNARTELVCGGVSKMNIRSLDPPVTTGGRQPPPPGSIPNRLRVALWSANEDEPSMDEVIHVF